MIRGVRDNSESGCGYYIPSEVLDDTAVVEEERATDDPGASSEEQTHDGRDDPHLGQLPIDRFPFVRRVVVGDGDGSNATGTVSGKGSDNLSKTHSAKMAMKTMRSTRMVSFRMSMDVH